jgi:hypothetical protein
LFALSTAVMSALSSRGVVCSVNFGDDHAGARAAQAVDGLRVATPLEGPVIPGVGEGLVVDGHHEQVRGRALRAMLVALDDRLLLEAREQAPEIGGAGHGRRDDAGHEDGHGPAAPAAGDAHGVQRMECAR